MSWRDVAAKYFQAVPAVPSVPGVGAVMPAGTVGTLGTPRSRVGKPDIEPEQHDAHVADWVDREERAAIMEYDGELQRVEAEEAATRLLKRKAQD